MDRSPLPLPPLRLAHATATSCLGHGLAAHAAALRAGRSGLKPCDFDIVELPTWIGEVPGVDAVDLGEAPVRGLDGFDCRNNRLAELALRQDGFAQAVEQAAARHGAQRVGVFVGTSTSGILQTELAYRRRDARGALPADFQYEGTQSNASLADFVARRLQLRGPSFVISSACSSSAKVFATAQRMIAAGLIDCAVVGGVDSLCLTTLYGFHALELLSQEPCRPFDAARKGLSLGEAGAFALLERVPARPADDDVLLLGCGESSDAYHMSSPHPEGLGARLAMQQALRQAGVRAPDIDYINLHGTATPSNDMAESRAVSALFEPGSVCNSTKGATGHTLGAAGGLEAVICLLALRQGFVPASPGTREPDPAIAGALGYRLDAGEAELDFAMSNSFGFGGTNCSLVLGRGDAWMARDARATPAEVVP
ncbi:beta-ketoacyl-[acyl-carrier-protein] synthase family protein [Thiomonas sp.]|uniref:beta-ketoacyl-[acyl-carrier-protein] synthase family protein n=1 Tax=Thiomonas sp. TaxID=2047785 RepID=UPI00260534E7|nr:beta-ketoacyl-[acyl-carrier-protein] synthase family protein [Thiomonas sp.]